jgi:hypothetical protein
MKTQSNVNHQQYEWLQDLNFYFQDSKLFLLYEVHEAVMV